VSDTNMKTDGQEVQATPKALLRLVYIMGIVLVLLFLGFIAAVIWKSSARKAAVATTPEIELGLQGAKVLSSTMQDGQLLVTTENELIVVDVGRKAIVLRVKTK
jgi:hypothetical protein